MAMDKEMLLQRLQSQYLTRQEVLYKLPLNITISSFWAELLERRKAKGIVLPLFRFDGTPYWYVLTKKMITASERLCDMALDNNDQVDPYKASMTTAMTEEMYFTSYVEGARIDFDEAMDFLERGGEPENVHEQLIYNNRNAWEDMVKMLFSPVDERFVRTLVYRLTEDLEGQAVDYRQTQNHPIAAMGTEAYEVPQASDIPKLMQDYYLFLGSYDVHPLIKAAVGHAYLLVARPFPEGNERLARMISYAILLRSGYEFFRDVSISSVIARENYLYYKRMQEIIRTENGGDLTYFVEYYLELLVRSVNAKREKEQQRHQLLLEAEKRAAQHPLASPILPPDKAHGQARTADVQQTTMFPSIAAGEQETFTTITRTNSRPMDNKENLREDQESFVNLGEGLPINNETGSLGKPIRSYSVQQYRSLLHYTREHGIENIQAPRTNRIIDGLLKLLQAGTYSFNRLDWETMCKISTGVAKQDCVVMSKQKLICCQPYKSMTEMHHYSLPITADDAVPNTEDNRQAATTTGKKESVQLAIQNMMSSNHTRERQAAQGLNELIKENIYVFSFPEWVQKCGAVNKEVGCSLIRIAMNYGLVEYVNGRYLILEERKDGPICYDLPDKQRSVLLQLMEAFSDSPFTIRAATEKAGLKYSTLTYYLDSFSQRGILLLERAPGNVNKYRFSSEVHAIFSASGATKDGVRFREIQQADQNRDGSARIAEQVG